MTNKIPLSNIPGWKPDVLGEDFFMRHVSQGCDYAGDVRCTIVRKLADNGCSRGILYIHGFCDYFFQKEMANRFVKEGYNFYAVDLRKYGRSYMDEQKMFQVRDLTEYFPDIQAGIEAMKEDGNLKIVLMGHSTGGLTTSLYMQRCADPCIKALILNSPFFAWNLPKAMIRFGIPILKTLAVLVPGIRVKGDGTNNYASTIARHLNGEWSYNIIWKPDIMPDVDAAWVRAIDNGQKMLRNGSVNVPVLLMHSDKSTSLEDPKECYHHADAILNVHDIATIGRHIGRQVKEVTIKNGLHDLILSSRDVREEVYYTMFKWLENK